MASVNEPAITLSVAHIPAEIPPEPERRAHTVSIVVDVIRATTTLAVMFERGVRRVWVARDVEAARVVRATLPGALVAGEIAAVAPPDFDCGNSPEEWGHLPGEVVTGREVLFSTTNGARALHASRGGGPIFAGSLRNATVVSRTALAAARELAADGGGAEVLVVCSGRDNLPAEDDSLCAAWLLATLRVVAGSEETPVTLDDAADQALDALDQLASARRVQVDAGRWLYERLRTSKPARDVLDVDLGADIAWCAALDASRAIPTVTGYDAARDLLIVERA
jgi:2-phosphosulfolactate phosphatase